MNRRRSLRDSALAQLTLVRFLEFWREPEAVFWTIGFPLLLVGGLGMAFRDRAPDPVPVAIVRTGPAAERIAEVLAKDSRLRVQLAGPGEAARLQRTGKAALQVIPSAGGEITYRYDDTNPDARTARLVFDDALQRASGRRDPLPSRDSLVREPGSRYIDFLVPGVLGMNLMGNGMWGLGFPIVDARRRKLLKRMVASPMSRAQYLLSFLLSRLIFVVVDIAFVLGLGHFLFGVPLQGSLLAMASISLLAALMFSSIGLLIAARVSH
jgi:ABC-2 type transport system permease protein